MSGGERIVTAWLTFGEWYTVYQQLFSNDPDKEKHAVGRISVWKSRVLHYLPSGIECTWQLMSALIQDREFQQSGQGNEFEQQIRLSYAMAVVRSVNHLTEKFRNKSCSQAVHILAEEIGLPLWIVEMRHDATHAGLPSLPLLQTATRYLLAWIKREYWDVIAEDEGTNQNTGFMSDADLKFHEKELSEMLIAYMQEQIKHISVLSPGTSAAVKALLKDVRPLIEKCGYNDDPDTVVKKSVEIQTVHYFTELKLYFKNRRYCERSALLLASEGYLLSTDEQLQALNVDTKEWRKGGSLKLPKMLAKFWNPVLCCYQLPQLLPRVLLYLAEGLTEEGSLHDKLRASWISAILRAFNKPVSQTGLHLKKIPCQLDGLHLLRTCLNHPNRYTSKLVICLFKELDLPLSSKQKGQLLNLLQHFDISDENGQEVETHDQDVYTLDSLLMASEAARASQANASGLRCRLADELLDWPGHPLGTCPNVTLTFSSLELDKSIDDLIGTEKLEQPSDNEISEEMAVNARDGDMTDIQLSLDAIKKKVSLF